MRRGLLVHASQWKSNPTVQTWLAQVRKNMKHVVPIHDLSVLIQEYLLPSPNLRALNHPDADSAARDFLVWFDLVDIDRGQRGFACLASDWGIQLSWDKRQLAKPKRATSDGSGFVFAFYYQYYGDRVTASRLLPVSKPHLPISEILLFELIPREPYFEILPNLYDPKQSIALWNHTPSVYDQKVDISALLDILDAVSINRNDVMHD
jgi:hypothetical protein